MSHLYRNAILIIPAISGLLLFSSCIDAPSRAPVPLEKMHRIDIQIVEGSPSFNGRGSFWEEGVYCAITPELQAPHSSPGGDVLVIKFVNRFDGYVHRPGTYDLGSSENRDHRFSRQSVEVLQDINGDNLQVRNYQARGTMILDSINVATGESAGKLLNVYFREIEMTGFFVWGGYTGYTTCLYLEYGEWNTFASVSRPCDIRPPPNCKLQVCDPVTGLSVRAQCFSEGSTCPEGGQCFIQHANYGVGACYPQCTPFTSSCGEGLECVQTSYTEETGICKRNGTIAPGNYCKGSVVTTSCVSGHVCGNLAPYWEYQNQCYRQCDYFGTSPVCAADRACALRFYSGEELRLYCYLGRCIQGGLCIPREWIDKAGIGQAAVSHGEAHFCALSGNRAQGVISREGTRMMCRKICRMGGSDCPPGTFCDTLTLHREWGGSSVPVTLGVCRPR